MSPITQAKLLLSFFALTTGLIGSCLVPKGAWASASEPPCEKKGEAPEIKTGISLEDLVARIQAKTCAFPGIEKKAFDQGQSEAQVFIQVGFVDEPSEKAPLKSYDSEILSAIEEHFLKDCPFKRESANSISLKYPAALHFDSYLVAHHRKGPFAPKPVPKTWHSLDLGCKKANILSISATPATDAEWTFIPGISIAVRMRSPFTVKNSTANYLKVFKAWRSSAVTATPTPHAKVRLRAQLKRAFDSTPRNKKSLTFKTASMNSKKHSVHFELTMPILRKAPGKSES